MIGILVRKDAAARLVVVLSLAGLAIGGLAAVVVRSSAQSAGGAPFVSQALALAPLLQVLAMCLLVLVAGAQSVRVRVPDHLAALPVSARTVLAVRITSIALVAWLPMVAMMLPLWAATPAAAAAVQGRVAACALAWAAWACACFAWRPSQPRLDSTPWLLAATGLGAALVALCLRAPAVGAAASLAAIVLYALGALRSVPHGVEVLADDLRRGTTGAPALLGARRTWVLRRTALRGRNAVLLPVLFLIAAVWAGEDRHGGNVVFVVWIAGTVVFVAAHVLREAAPLPIPRARLAPWVLLPPLAVLFAGLAVGEAGLIRPRWTEPVDLARRSPGADDPTDHSHVVVPGRLWRLGWGRAPETVAAPWGETASIEPVPVFPGLPVVLRNPYDVDAESSIDFVAWQLARAVRDTFGYDADPDALREAHLSVLHGEVIGPFFGQRFGEAHPDLEPERGFTLRLAALVAVAFWVLGAAFALRPGTPPGTPDAWRRTTRLRVYAGVGLAALFVVVLIAPFHAPYGTPSSWDVARGALVRLGPGWAFAAVALALGAVAYAWLQRRFERMEVPPPLKAAWRVGP